MLQRGIRHQFCSVLSSYHLEKPSQNPVVPKLVVFQKNGSFDLTKTFCPQYIVNKGRRQRTNPFPSKSLCIARTPYIDPKFGSETIYVRKSLVGFMSNFGHHLTVLSIGRGRPYECFCRDLLTLRETDLVFILSRTPNLKALQLYRVMMNRAPKKQELPLLNKLTSLKTLQSGGVVYGGIPLTVWLLQAYSKQLYCLQVDRKYQTAMSLEDYPKLQELRVSVLILPYLLPSDALPLRHLVIFRTDKKSGFDKDLEDTVSFAVATKFIENFAATLEHLKVPLSSFSSKRDKLELDSRNRASSRPAPSVVFPELKTFGVEYSVEAEDKDLLKQYFLPKFPTLQILDLCTATEGTPHLRLEDVEEKRMATEFLTQSVPWEKCGKLSRIQVYANTDRPLILLVKDLKV